MGRALGLNVCGVQVAFTGRVVLEDVSLSLAEGAILGLIGPNGAGKSTLVNVISGYQRPERGSVTLDGVDVTRKRPHRICRLGLARTFQAGRLFGRLTVAENIEVGALGGGMTRRGARAVARRLLREQGLEAVAGVEARALPQGDERRLSLARVLASEPRFLLLDEPAAGLDDRESDELRKTIASLRERLGCGILVIEHDMGLIMRLCDRIHVLNGGRTVSIGTPAEVQADRAVIEAYLGADADLSAAKATAEAALTANPAVGEG